MIKMIFTSLVLVAFVACGKKNDDSPRAPINPQKDTQQVQDSKKAAQEEPPKDGDATKADGGDKTQPTPTPAAPETKSGNAGGSNPAPTPAVPTPTPTPAPDTTPAPTPVVPPIVAGDQGADKKEDIQKQTPPAPETPAPKTDEAPKAEVPPAAPEKTDEQKDVAKKDEAPEEKKAEPAPKVEEQKPETPSTAKANEAQGEVPFKLGQGYDGANLNLVANKKNYGEVLLKDEDARRLYQALRVKENATGGSKEWLPGKKKIGTHVTCYTQESRTQKGVFANRCVLAMNFVKGELIQAPTQLAPDLTAKELREAYQGKNLRLIYPDNRRTAWLTLAAMDAKAIYSVMNVPAKVSTTTKGDYQASEFKASRNIYCVRHIPKANPNNPLYGCSLQLDYATGLAMVVKK